LKMRQKQTNQVWQLWLTRLVLNTTCMGNVDWFNDEIWTNVKQNLMMWDITRWGNVYISIWLVVPKELGMLDLRERPMRKKKYVLAHSSRSSTHRIRFWLNVNDTSRGKMSSWFPSLKCQMHKSLIFGKSPKELYKRGCMLGSFACFVQTSWYTKEHQHRCVDSYRWCVDNQELVMRCFIA
jgi:hypothetical protein